MGEISPKQQIIRLQNGRNSPKSEEIRPKFLRAILNCADSPVLGEKNDKKSTVHQNLKKMCIKLIYCKNYTMEIFRLCLWNMLQSN
jgi:hypothetical protein